MSRELTRYLIATVDTEVRPHRADKASVVEGVDAARAVIREILGEWRVDALRWGNGVMEQEARQADERGWRGTDDRYCGHLRRLDVYRTDLPTGVRPESDWSHAARDYDQRTRRRWATAEAHRVDLPQSPDVITWLTGTGDRPDYRAWRLAEFVALGRVYSARIEEIGYTIMSWALAAARTAEREQLSPRAYAEQLDAEIDAASKAAARALIDTLRTLS